MRGALKAVLILAAALVLPGAAFAQGTLTGTVRDQSGGVLPGVTVDRNYRMVLPPSFTATCHLQGVNEATHGIADSLLSVLAIRSQDIVNDLLAHRRAPRLPDGPRQGVEVVGRRAGLHELLMDVDHFPAPGSGEALGVDGAQVIGMRLGEL